MDEVFFGKFGVRIMILPGNVSMARAGAMCLW